MPPETLVLSPVIYAAPPNAVAALLVKLHFEYVTVVGRRKKNGEEEGWMDKEEKERTAVREYDNFKNIYDLKLDELNRKKIKFENKIQSLRNKINIIENNKDESTDELGESKKFLVNLLKNLKNIN